jgi:hypothetical protein
MHRATIEMQEQDEQGNPVVVAHVTGRHDVESGAKAAIMRWLEEPASSSSPSPEG